MYIAYAEVCMHGFTTDTSKPLNHTSVISAQIVTFVMNGMGPNAWYVAGTFFLFDQLYLKRKPMIKTVHDTTVTFKHFLNNLNKYLHDEMP